MSDLHKNCNPGQQKQTLRISSPPRPIDPAKTPAYLGLRKILSRPYLSTIVHVVFELPPRNEELLQKNAWKLQKIATWFSIF